MPSIAEAQEEAVRRSREDRREFARTESIRKAKGQELQDRRDAVRKAAVEKEAAELAKKRRIKQLREVSAVRMQACQRGHIARTRQRLKRASATRMQKHERGRQHRVALYAFGRVRPHKPVRSGSHHYPEYANLSYPYSPGVPLQSPLPPRRDGFAPRTSFRPSFLRKSASDVVPADVAPPERAGLRYTLPHAEPARWAQVVERLSEFHANYDELAATIFELHCTSSGHARKPGDTVPLLEGFRNALFEYGELEGRWLRPVIKEGLDFWGRALPALQVRASHRIASHRIASHRIASHRIASHRIASHRPPAPWTATHCHVSHALTAALLRLTFSN